MTSMNRDTDYSNLAQAIRFAIRQSLKDLYTCMPGVVESYDGETQRAVVKGALNIDLFVKTPRQPGARWG